MIRRALVVTVLLAGLLPLGVSACGKYGPPVRSIQPAPPAPKPSAQAPQTAPVSQPAPPTGTPPAKATPSPDQSTPPPGGATPPGDDTQSP